MPPRRTPRAASVRRERFARFRPASPGPHRPAPTLPPPPIEKPDAETGARAHVHGSAADRSAGGSGVSGGPGGPPAMLYDDQAARFDARAGVPPQAAQAVARALAELAGLRPGDVLLEVGAGTGGLSLAFLALPVRYVGFDRSPAMLQVFRERAAKAGVEAELHVADGNGRWPVPDRSVDAVFSSRALHHLDPAHAAAETRRVLRPGGVLAVGRVRRPPDSPKSVLRREMRRLLGAAGLAGLDADGAARGVFAALEREGGGPVRTVTAARWTVRHAPVDSLAAWEEKAGLAGLDLPAPLKARVLDGVRQAARARYGDLSAALPQEETFEITTIAVGVRPGG